MEATALPLPVYLRSMLPTLPVIWMSAMRFCFLCGSGVGAVLEVKPVHAGAVFHPRPVTTGAETVGDAASPDPGPAPPLDAGDSRVVGVGSDTDTELGPSELHGRAAGPEVAGAVAAQRVAGVGFHEHRGAVGSVTDAVECGDDGCRVFVVVHALGAQLVEGSDGEHVGLVLVEE